jgi:hypothetical protein
MTPVVVDPTIVLGKLAVPVLAIGVDDEPTTKLRTNCGPSPEPESVNVAESIISLPEAAPGTEGVKLTVKVAETPTGSAKGSGLRLLT